MRYDQSGKMSQHIEDRRGKGRRGGRTAVAGGGGISLIGLLIFIVFRLFFGGSGDIGTVIGDIGGGPVAHDPINVETGGAATTEQEQFISFVIDDVHSYWTEQFAQNGQTYVPAPLVLYEGSTPTDGCGYGQAGVGPFYCPADSKVYLDLSFFQELEQRFDAPGDFAQAYVIAHEVGHHVQNELGISEAVRQAQREDPRSANQYSVRLELQADCLAGVWAHSAYQDGSLSPGDLEEGINAASAVGDDTIQARTGTAVNPESWTHGSSQDRMRWFREGFDSGNPDQCNTFERE